MATSSISDLGRGKFSTQDHVMDKFQCWWCEIRSYLLLLEMIDIIRENSWSGPRGNAHVEGKMHLYEGIQEDTG